MKDKIVIWGENEKEEKIMMGIHLISEENKIEIHIFPESSVTETFEKAMMNEWRKGENVDFPEGVIKIERELAVSEPLLPDSLKTKETDLVNRAKSEWLFVVLSQKLSHEFRKELDELKDKIEDLSEYNSALWNDLKGYWSKVQTQMKEKTLIWQHTKELKDVTNGLFDKMKVLRTQFEGQLQEKSGTYKAEFADALNDIEEKIKKDSRLKPLFEELKGLQKKFWDTQLVSKHRNELKKKFDKTFKVIKEKRFGNEPSGISPVDRLVKRLEGLDNAIHRMKSSIKRDTNELEFQQRRIDNTDGQLEAQIRQAKINVVQERVNSKEHKLEDMLKTKVELEDRLLKAKDRAEKQKVEADKKAALAKAKEAAKVKIATEIKEKGASVSSEEATKLAQAAEKIKQPATTTVTRITRVVPRTDETKTVETEPKKVDAKTETKTTETKTEEIINAKAENKTEDIIGGVTTVLGGLFEDIVDSAKAVAEVLEDKVDDFINDMKESEEE